MFRIWAKGHHHRRDLPGDKNLKVAELGSMNSIRPPKRDLEVGNHCVFSLRRFKPEPILRHSKPKHIFVTV